MCYCHTGKRVFGPIGVYVECVECGHTFTDPNNVGNLPMHSRKCVGIDEYQPTPEEVRNDGLNAIGRDRVAGR